MDITKTDIYVGPLFNTRRSKKWRHDHVCHLMSLDIEALHLFANKIGLKFEWFQTQSMPHYDLTIWKRRQAIFYGAIEITENDEITIIRKLRKSISGKQLKP